MTTTLSYIAEELRTLADELEGNTTSINFYPRGTIVKAIPDQTRFKSKSMWVSLGDGCYKHLTGKKGLVTTHDRLEGFTSVVFEA